jgi:hypothetical protein
LTLEENVPRRLLLAAPYAALLVAGLAGCGKQTLVAGLLIGTPHLPDPTGQTSGFGPYTILTGAVATIDVSDPTKIQDAKIQGVAGATATLLYRSCAALSGADLTSCQATGESGQDRVFSVPDKGNGVYALFSGDVDTTKSPPLTFETGVHYTLVLEVPTDTTDSEAYGASFTPGPAAHMVEFADKTQVKQIPLGQTIPVTRDDAKVDNQYLPAFLLVGKVDLNNPTAEPSITYTSLDYNDPKTLVELALSDIPYRVGSFAIPSNAFPSQGYYIVALLSISEGKASANAFLGSTSLAGSGDVGLVQVQ